MYLIPNTVLAKAASSIPRAPKQSPSSQPTPTPSNYQDTVQLTRDQPPKPPNDILTPPKGWTAKVGSSGFEAKAWAGKSRQKEFETSTQMLGKKVDHIAKGKIDVNAQAEFKTKAKLDKNGLGAEGKAGAKAGFRTEASLTIETDLAGGKVKKETKAFAGAEVGVENNEKLKVTKNEVDARNFTEAKVGAEVGISQSTSYSGQAGKIETTQTTKAKAEAKASTEQSFKANKDEVTLKMGGEANVIAGSEVESEVKVQTKNGSELDLKAGTSTNSYGAKANLEVSRKSGETKVDVNIGGNFMYGGSAGVTVTVKDKDIKQVVNFADKYNPVSVTRRGAIKLGQKVAPFIPKLPW